MISGLNKNNYLLLLFAGMMMLSSSSYAQGNDSSLSFQYNPGAMLNQRLKEIQQHRMETEAAERYENREEEEAEYKPDEEQKPELPQVTVKLNKLDIPDSQVLKRDELDAIAAKYENKEVSISELYDALSEINELYSRKGYLTTKAILPPQKIEEGVVKIQLIEGMVGKVEVINNKFTKSKYITDRLSLKEGKVPNVNALKHRLQRFNGTNNTILQIKMVAGEKPLTTDFYIVAVEPKKKQQFFFFSDNSGSETSGEFRAGIGYNNNNLTGKCDTAAVSTMYSKTSETTMVSYNTPVNKRGTEVGVNYSNNHMRVSKGYMKPLDVRGRSNTTGIIVNTPSFITANRREQWNIEFQKQHSETSIAGGTFVNDKETRWALGYTGIRIKPHELFFYKPQFTYNSYKGLDSKKYGGRLVLDAMWQKFQSKGDSLTVRINAQKAFSDYIPSADQYYLGGQYTVRGYEANGIGGDSGVNVRIDKAWHTGTDGLKVITFADYGRLFGETILTTRQIYSVGWGLEYRKGNFVITFYAGYALKRRIGDQKTDASNTHFSLNYIFD